jgi:tetratricopeptide (TPR) repeat protein
MSNTKGKITRIPCFPSEAWIGLACGTIGGEEADRMIRHAGECAACAAKLEEAQAIVADDPSDSQPPGDDAENSARLEVLGQMMARPPGSVRRWRVIGGAIAAVLLIGFGARFLLIRASPPLDELAAAYEQGRSMELRIAGARHAPERVNRSTTGQPAQDSPELLESLAVIQRRLRDHPSDSDWLHAAGQASLLRWKHEEAIQKLEAANTFQPDRSEVLFDLATAYCQRGEATDSATDLVKASELLSRVLRKDPNNTAALFNRGIIFGRLGLYDAAIRDLEACAKGDPDTGWRAEALRRVEALREKQNLQRQPREGGARFQPEASMAAALRSFPPATASSSGPDVWLSEAWAQRGLLPPAVAVGLQRLAAIRSAGSTGEYVALADEIRKLARLPLSPPFAAWRDFELLFAASHSDLFSYCDLAADFQQRADQRGYFWFAAQASIEAATCAMRRGAVPEAQQRIVAARDLAERHGLPALAMRAAGLFASQLADEGRYREALELANQSRKRIEAGNYPVCRLHEIYNVIKRTAERMQLWTPALAAAEMAIRVGQHCGYHDQTAAFLFAMSEFAARTGALTESRRHSAAAEAIAAGLPLHSPVLGAVNLNRVGALHWQGNLPAIRKVLSDTPALNVFAEVHYRSAAAELALQQGLLEEAWQESTSALSLLVKGVEAGNTDKRAVFRREHDRVSRVRVEVLVRRSRFVEGLHEWQQATAREALLWQKSSLTASADPPPAPEDAHHTFVDLSGRIARWTQHMGNTTFVWLGPADSILRQARRLRLLASNPAVELSEIDESSQRLRSTLFPLLSATGVRQHRVSVRGELGAIPLALLLESTASMTPLSGVRAAPKCSPPLTSATAILATRVSSAFQEAAYPLPALRAEADSLQTAFPEAAVLDGNNASPERIGAAFRHSRLVHFGGHAVMAPGGITLLAAPMPTAPDPQHRLGQWRIGADGPVCAETVVLSACSTATFRETDSLLPSQSAEAALAAGARQVVAALWDIDSNATADLMKHFYQALRGQASVEEALYSASRAVRSDPRYRHPYYWAGFNLYR